MLTPVRLACGWTESTLAACGGARRAGGTRAATRVVREHYNVVKLLAQVTAGPLPVQFVVNLSQLSLSRGSAASRRQQHPGARGNAAGTMAASASARCARRAGWPGCACMRCSAARGPAGPPAQRSDSEVCLWLPCCATHLLSISHMPRKITPCNELSGWVLVHPRFVVPICRYICSEYLWY